MTKTLQDKVDTLAECVEYMLDYLSEKRCGPAVRQTLVEDIRGKLESEGILVEVSPRSGAHYLSRVS